MNKLVAISVVITLSITMAGCNIWIKRGAGADQLTVDQAECAAQAGGDAAGPGYLECMQGRGWYHQDKSLEPVGAEPRVWPKPLPSDSAPPVPHEPRTGEPPGHEKGSPPADSAEEAPEVEIRRGYDVGSWWKIGGTTEQLHQDQQACLSELGSAGSSSGLQWSATPEFVHCMKQKGWYGFSE